VLAGGGSILGSYGLGGPPTPAVCLLVNLLLAAVALVRFCWIAPRPACRRGLLVALLVAAVSCESLLVAAYVVIWEPRRLLNRARWWNQGQVEDPAEVRALSHRSLALNPDPHDEFIALMRYGDETSVPHILWALRGMPEEGFRMCTWDHGLDALSWITNNSPGSTRRAWVRWYDKNKHRTRLQWWADGFTAEGYPVSAAGGEPSIRSLFAVLGRTPWCLDGDKPWLSGNAPRMLAIWDSSDVARVAEDALRTGSTREQCGLALYAGERDRAEAEPILRRLLGNDQRAVRLFAGGVLSHLQRTWYKNPPGSVVDWFEAGTGSDGEFFTPAGRVAVAGRVAAHHNIWGSERERFSRIQTGPVRRSGRSGGPTCTITIDWESPAGEDLASIGIEGVSLATGDVVYSRELIVTTVDGAEELRWVYDANTDRLYVSLPLYTCKAARRTGRVVWERGFGTGNAGDLVLLGAYLVIARHGALTVYDASDGEVLAHYDLPRQCLGSQVSLVDGRLRATDHDGARYIYTLPAAGAGRNRPAPASQTAPAEGEMGTSMSKSVSRR